MLVRSSIRGNAAAAKSRGLSQVERHYVVGSVIFALNLASFARSAGWSSASQMSRAPPNWRITPGQAVTSNSAITAIFKIIAIRP
jgi:hypothetical protein